ncbi:MAG: hypothetical protein KR126chlam2_00379 [Chlamydiae bacterium]|nr:hypothetical protein [Chlamydiota bacterium]
MSHIKSKIISYCAILTLCFSVCFGSQPQMDNNPLGLTKAYVTQNNIFFQDGHLLIVDDQNLLCVNTLHQDSCGMYYYYASLYGNCPNGHPYTADGGCLGYNCPYN